MLAQEVVEKLYKDGQGMMEFARAIEREVQKEHKAKAQDWVELGRCSGLLEAADLAKATCGKHTLTELAELLNQRALKIASIHQCGGPGVCVADVAKTFQDNTGGQAHGS